MAHFTLRPLPALLRQAHTRITTGLFPVGLALKTYPKTLSWARHPGSTPPHVRLLHCTGVQASYPILQQLKLTKIPIVGGRIPPGFRFLLLPM